MTENLPPPFLKKIFFLKKTIDIIKLAILIFKNGGTSMSIRSQKNVLISNTSFGFIFFFHSPVHPKKKEKLLPIPIPTKKPTPLPPSPRPKLDR